MRTAPRCGRLRVGGERRIQSAGGVCARRGGRRGGGRVMLFGSHLTARAAVGPQPLWQEWPSPKERGEKEKEGGEAVAALPSRRPARG